MVDDDLDFVQSTKLKLEAMGFTVGVAYDGRKALEQVPKFKPDLVVLDVMMPVMNGREACQKLKADPATQNIPVILLTAVGDHVTTTTYSHRDVLESNADDYLPKPLRLEVLLNSIKRLLSYPRKTDSNFPMVRFRGRPPDLSEVRGTKRIASFIEGRELIKTILKHQ